ncbi:MAG: KpsF/GutQ family sugar-phosphate isomerase [Deltaproteobacteria bacterium]|nr:KpsF/GutQ family sugar-phosphate isomerase [Deltaproteobacteria bacterium]
MIEETGRRVLKIEAQAILDLVEKVDDGFVRAVELISTCKGKIVLTGIGKSGLIGKKIASTLASTGTPAFFMHPAEGIHGDLGMLSKKDIVIIISNSGETEEITQLMPIFKRMRLKTIILTGTPNSSVASGGDITINTSIKEEACPWGLIPTSSTTAALAMGDALAIAVLEKRGFKEENFAVLHPGGALGKRLLLRVKDIMHREKAIPVVAADTLIKEALLEMTSKRLGMTGVFDKKQTLLGVITDGDLRRALERQEDLMNLHASELMTTEPKRISQDALAAHALRLMEEHAITSLFVYKGKQKGRVVGVIHMHDILKEGIV